MELEKIRQEIDAIDQQLVSLLERRMQCVERVIRYKQAHQISVLDKVREEEILERVASQVKDQRYKASIVASFHDLLEVSRDYQKSLLLSDEEAVDE